MAHVKGQTYSAERKVNIAIDMTEIYYDPCPFVAINLINDENSDNNIDTETDTDIVHHVGKTVKLL